MLSVRPAALPLSLLPGRSGLHSASVGALPSPQQASSWRVCSRSRVAPSVLPQADLLPVAGGVAELVRWCPARGWGTCSPLHRMVSVPVSVSGM